MVTRLIIALPIGLKGLRHSTTVVIFICLPTVHYSSRFCIPGCQAYQTGSVFTLQRLNDIQSLYLEPFVYHKHIRGVIIYQLLSYPFQSILPHIRYSIASFYSNPQYIFETCVII